MYYYLILLLQGYCIYHLIKNRNDYYWIFLIVFLPVIGCIIYLITQVFNKRDTEKIANDLVLMVNPTKKVKDLEQQLQFSETFQNRINLADAYLEIKDYTNAFKQYSIAHKNDDKDIYTIKQIIVCLYEIGDYDELIAYAEAIKDHTGFLKSRSQFLYGLALEQVNELDKAEIQLRAMDRRYSNYEERLTLVHFLIRREKTNDAKEILNDIYNESQHMTKPNRKKYHKTIQEVTQLLKQL